MLITGSVKTKDVWIHAETVTCCVYSGIEEGLSCSYFHEHAGLTLAEEVERYGPPNILYHCLLLRTAVVLLEFQDRAILLY